MQSNYEITNTLLNESRVNRGKTIILHTKDTDESNREKFEDIVKTKGYPQIALGRIYPRIEPVNIQLAGGVYRLEIVVHEKQEGWPISATIKLTDTNGGKETPYKLFNKNYHPGEESGTLVVFGQPNFIQNPVYPLYKGVLASHLATLFDDHGDSGNINILVSLDKKTGLPIIAWFEESCY